MEILILVLLYYLSQNPDFHESVKPLMGQLKNSEQFLSFLNDLSKFAQTFSTLNNQPKKEETPPQASQTEPKKEEKETKQKETQSPTAGIADDFIQQILEGYLKKH